MNPLPENSPTYRAGPAGRSGSAWDSSGAESVLAGVQARAAGADDAALVEEGFQDLWPSGHDAVSAGVDEGVVGVLVLRCGAAEPDVDRVPVGVGLGDEFLGRDRHPVEVHRDLQGNGPLDRPRTGGEVVQQALLSGCQSDG